MNKKKFKKAIMEVIESDGNVLTEIDKDSINYFIDIVYESYDEDFDTKFFESSKSKIKKKFYKNSLCEIAESSFNEPSSFYLSIEETLKDGVKSLPFAITKTLSLHGLALENGETYYYDFYAFC
ncbi:hypothetical protein [Staphylococcus phage vB_StaM_SA1]|nr:hypothetical protein [Staphylococcus phage vB_StaM_SA1]